MPPFEALIAWTVFAAAVILIIWRPRGLSEAIPAAAGAVILIGLGVVPPGDLLDLFDIVGGAALTILSTIAMSIVMDGIGVFRWAAHNLVRLSRGSGVLLYWNVVLLCFLMTMFFNNDGSILITTPILIRMLTMLRFEPRRQLPFLFAGALVATASSAPIGVSNLANLIAMRIVGLDLETYALYMFVPSLAGIGCIAGLLFLIFRKDIPREIPTSAHAPHPGPHGPVRRGQQDAGKPTESPQGHPPEKPAKSLPVHPLKYGAAETPPETGHLGVIRLTIGIVVLTRAGFFLGSGMGIPIEWIGIAGAAALVLARWIWLGRGPKDLITQAPWHIIVFAFGIYVIVHAFHQSGAVDAAADFLGRRIDGDRFAAIFWMGGWLTLLSVLMNNLPAVMIGTMSLTQMNLETDVMQSAYMTNILGSDIGALLVPVGTLASLLWMFILRSHRIPITWGKYVKVAFAVVPAGLVVSLFTLYFWTGLFY